jgi:hypothetical protein
MMIRRVREMLVVAVALMASLNALAVNKIKTTPTAADSAYNFRCVGPALDLTLDSFSLPISRSTAIASASAGAAKPPTSSLTIDFPANKAYSTLYSQVIKGDHYSSCTLVETVTVSGGAAGSTVFTWTFSQVTPTNVTAIWRNTSSTGSANPGSQGTELPVAQIRVTLTYSEIRFDDGSGSSSKAATDSWTQMQ